MTLPSSRLRFSRTPARTPASALTLGRDSDFVLREMLGYDEQRLDADELRRIVQDLIESS